MFVPKTSHNIKVGDTVVCISNIDTYYGVFTIGHKFTVLRLKDNYSRLKIKDNEHGMILNEYHKHFTLDVSIKEAQKYEKRRLDIISAENIIKKYCPLVKHNLIDDRDYYDGCDDPSKKHYYINECKPSLKCLKHLSNIDIKNNDILLRESRLIKIKNLKNGL